MSMRMLTKKVSTFLLPLCEMQIGSLINPNIKPAKYREKELETYFVKH